MYTRTLRSASPRHAGPGSVSPDQGLVSVASALGNRTLSRALTPAPAVSGTAIRPLLPARAARAGERRSRELARRSLAGDAGPRTAQREGSSEPIVVALYLPPELEAAGRAEFQRQAVQWARNHDAVGVDERGEVRRGTAMPIPNGRPQEALRNVMNAVRRSSGAAPDAAVPLRTLAIFTHGRHDGLQVGLRDRQRSDGQDGAPAGGRSRSLYLGLERLRPLLDLVADAIVAHGDVIFYACNAAGPIEPVPGEEYRNLVQQAHDYIAERSGRDDVEVWGHNTAGHTTGNADTASASERGREQLHQELAERSFAHYAGRQVNGTDRARALRSLGALWQRALRPPNRAAQAAYHSVIEEVPLLGYDAFFRVAAGIDDVGTALRGFRTYTARDRALFEEGIGMIRARFDVTAARAAATGTGGGTAEPPPAAASCPVDPPPRR